MTAHRPMLGPADARPDADLPSILRAARTDEWAGAAAPLVLAGPARERVRDLAVAERQAAPVIASSRRATAIGLRAINEAAGAEFYRVPVDAESSEAAAAHTFASTGPVVDVQTHFLAPHAAATPARDLLFDLYQAVMPDWWSEMDDVVAWSFAEYVRNVFVESETALAVLTSGPGLLASRHLFNDEMAASRVLFDESSGVGRLLNHAVVHADVADEVERMAEWNETLRPVGWKVYTPGNATRQGWMLDDEQCGTPFLEGVRATGTGLVCAHKGISQLADNGSPRDVGPAARAFPDLDFVIYHSGYELATHGAAPEGPYSGGDPQGVDRLLASLDAADVAAGANVYAELGSTWFCLLRRPVEAAHVLGKLIRRLGADNVIWGTDSIWFGSPQPLIDAFRTFQIPESMCDEFGYEPLTDAVRAKILGENAARVYGLDLGVIAALSADHDRSWALELADRYQHGRLTAFR